MKFKCMAQIVILLGNIIAFHSYVAADPPAEYHHIAYEDISKNVLKQTIGIATLYSVTHDQDLQITTYQRKNNQFVFSKKLDFREHMIPLSICGYFRPAKLSKKEYEVVAQALPEVKGKFKWAFVEKEEYISMVLGDPAIDPWLRSQKAQLGNELYYQLMKYQRLSVYEGAFRYPIIAKDHDYLQIVYDPIRNVSTWINSKELLQNCRYVMLEELSTYRGNYIDVSYFVPNKNRRTLYIEPGDDAKTTELVANRYNTFGALVITEQKNGFVKIARVDNLVQKKELGWIKLRDSQGCLTIWLICLDLC